ncbi:MAG: hypothetical protein Kapaf2KO_04570 [Candidatus Kapaibacteriales bacterium]
MKAFIYLISFIFFISCSNDENDKTYQEQESPNVVNLFANINFAVDGNEEIVQVNDSLVDYYFYLLGDSPVQSPILKIFKDTERTIYVGKPISLTDTISEIRRLVYNPDATIISSSDSDLAIYNKYSLDSITVSELIIEIQQTKLSAIAIQHQNTENLIQKDELEKKFLSNN